MIIKDKIYERDIKIGSKKHLIGSTGKNINKKMNLFIDQ